MEDTERQKPEPLNESEKKALKSISEQIAEAAINNEWETVSWLRRQLTNAARLDIISPEDARDASLPPTEIGAGRNRETE